MEDLNIKTVRFPVETDGKLIKMADKFGRSKINLFKQWSIIQPVVGVLSAPLTDAFKHLFKVSNHYCLVKNRNTI